MFGINPSDYKVDLKSAFAAEPLTAVFALETHHA
jgi:hypothetical protein